MANNTQNPETPAAEVNAEELQGIVELQGDAMADQRTEIDALKAELASLKASSPVKTIVVKGGTFKLGSKEYAVQHGVQVRDGMFLRTANAGDIMKDKVLQKHLVETNSSAVKEI